MGFSARTIITILSLQFKNKGYNFYFMFNLYQLLLPEERYCWVKVRILHETVKAVLVYLGINKQWIPKSKIYKTRLRNNEFEIYVKVSVTG